MKIVVLVLAGIGAFVLYGVIGGLIARLTGAERKDDDWAIVCYVVWPVLFLLVIPGLFSCSIRLANGYLCTGRDREETASEP